MNDEETVYLTVIIASILGTLLTVFLIILTILCIRRCLRQSTESEAVGQNAESFAMPPDAQNMTHCTDGRIERDQNINNMTQEQVYQVQNESRPHPEPSAPPLPPEYYIEYT